MLLLRTHYQLITIGITNNDTCDMDHRAKSLCNIKAPERMDHKKIYKKRT